METTFSGIGHLRVRTFSARDAQPVPAVAIRVYDDAITTLLYEGVTDENGILDDIDLPVPPRELSLSPNTEILPYATYAIVAEAELWQKKIIVGSQFFDLETTLAQIPLMPIADDETSRTSDIEPPEQTVLIPTHALFANEGGSGPSPVATCPIPRILTEPVIPQTITVHLGTPTSNARNVTVSFRDYIKNVASSEIYPTWPEQSLRANIHAQISLALNRVFTEWYKSKGYSFQITNSTSYDQYYVYGRTIFDVMSRITDEIFDTYVRRPGNIDPYYTEYCDGKIATCNGMKQWGTVTQADNGKNALEILKFYYGNNLEIVRSSNIAAIPESYPGTPLRVGSTGTDVAIIQRQLNRITRNYPGFGTVTVDGSFGAATAEVVKRFQRQFNLTADGVVGRATWYQISYIYVAVKKLAELTSEGEQPSGSLVAGAYPGTVLRIGSTGTDVMQMQFWLSEIAFVTNGLSAVAQDGVFGASTDAAVREFQSIFGLTVDGLVGKTTWDAIYKQFLSVESDRAEPDVDTTPGAYPGTPLKNGSEGNSVKLMQFYLRIISQINTAIPVLTADGIFGSGTESAVVTFQSFYGLTADGVVGPLTWNKIYEVYTDLTNGLLAPSARPGTYPGSPLRQGSTGQSVKEMQYYLYLLSAYYSEIPRIAYDGVFGSATTAAVRAYQSLFKLTVDGVVGAVTWASIYNQFSILRNVDGPVYAFRVFAYPGYDLQLGSSGDIVKFVQLMLAYIGAFYPVVLPVTSLSGVYDTELEESVQSFQKNFGETITGIIDETTWYDLVTIYLSLAADAGSNATEDGEYPGYVLVLGSAGRAVLQLQTYINAIATRYCLAEFVAENGIFDTLTLSAVREFQVRFELPETGLVDRATWDAIYTFYTMEE